MHITGLRKSIITAGFVLISFGGIAETRYVDQNNPAPVPPFTSWLTAATSIQDAIDAAVDGDLVLVTNGVYASGGREVYAGLTNRVAITKPLTVQSVNGPSVTVIRGFQVPGVTNGAGAVRCVYATNGVVLNGFTLTNGATLSTGADLRLQLGGGIWCESTSTIVSNCVLTGNSSGYMGGAMAFGRLWSSTISGNTSLNAGGGAVDTKMYDCLLSANFADTGGGAVGGELHRCIVSNNVAVYGGGVSDAAVNQSIVISNSAWWGGGAYDSSLLNSVLVGNSAGGLGGGTENCSVLNSIVYYNNAPANANFSGGDSYSYSCTTPLPSSGPGCFTDEPLFVGLEAHNYQLQSSSPCINAGRNTAYLPTTNTTDFANQPRVVGGVIDVGLYEFQNPASALSYAWAKQYGLPIDGTADFTDLDGDGLSNYGEWHSDTMPNDTNSVLRILAVADSTVGLEVKWQSTSTRSYALERSTNLTSQLQFELVNVVNGSPDLTSCVDTTATNGGPYFYRIRVQ